MHAILFAGSDSLSLPTLSLLFANNWVQAVLSAPPRKRGQGGTVCHTPVAEFAERHAIPLFYYDRLGEKAYNDIAQTGCTILIAAAYGYYFPSRFLSLFIHGTFNLHPSLLPRFRGASPIIATLLSGDHWAGVSIIEIAKEIDSGALWAQKRVECTPDMSKHQLRTWCSEEGARLILSLLQKMSHTTLPAPRAQAEHEAVYCRKIKKTDGHIEWSLPADMIMRAIVAFHDWPGSFTTLRNKRLILHSAHVYNKHVYNKEVAMHKREHKREAGAIVAIDPAEGICVRTGNGILAIKRLQCEHKSPLDWHQFINEYHISVGERFT